MTQLSDTEIQDLFMAIAPLTSAQREDALARATAQIKSYMTPPNRADYVGTVISEYPAWLRRGMLIALMVLLLASATPSFFRMVYAGATYFKHGINDDVQAVLVGFAIFLMAEIMLVLVGISRQVLFTNNPTARQISLGVMGLAFSLSLVGNWTVARPYDLFGWLETITPPFATIAIAMILEGLILDTIKSRHADEVSYQQAVTEYRKLVNDPKQHPRWQIIYHGQIKDMIARVNAQGAGATARKQILASLTPAHWSYLISREYAYEQRGVDIVTINNEQLVGGYIPTRAMIADKTVTAGVAVSHLSDVQNGRTSDKTDGRTSDGHHAHRPKTASQKVFDWLDEHPDDCNLDVRTLAQKIGIGKTTVASARKDWLALKEDKS